MIRCALAILAALQICLGETVDTAAVTFNYQCGVIELENGLARISLDSGFKYLNPQQSGYVLEKLWGNPPMSNLGMILPAALSPADSDSWAVVMHYEEEGYVKDKDADKINYDKLLTSMQKDIRKDNRARQEQGYEPIELLGWAERPFYDGAAKKLYWGKELKFGDATHTTLNYDVRILGRRGYLVMTAVASMRQLDQIKPAMQTIIGAVAFTPGNQYADFDPKVDRTAAYSIAALVAGGVLAKAGFFKLALAGIIAMKKFIIIGLIALAAILKGIFGRKKPDQAQGE